MAQVIPLKQMNTTDSDSIYKEARLSWHLDVRLYFTKISPEIESIFGWQESEMIHTSCSNFFTDDSFRLFEIHYSSLLNDVVIDKKDPYEVSLSVTVVSKKRQLFSGKAHLSLTYNELNQVNGVMISMTDIKKMNRVYIPRPDGNFYKSMIGMVPVVIAINTVDPFRCIWINHQVSYASGHTVEQWMSFDHIRYMSLFHPDDQLHINEILGGFFQSKPGTVVEFEYRCCTPKNTWVWLKTRLADFKRDDAGNISEIIGATINITKEKEMQQQLEDQQAKLQAMNVELQIRVEKEVALRMRQEQLLVEQRKLASMGEMIGAIAHQWRQPIATLGMILQNINRAYSRNLLSPELMGEMVEDGDQQIHFMSRTIDDFRNFFLPSKEAKAFNLHQALSDCLSLLNAQLETHFIPHQLINNDQSLMITGFPNEFKQVILNIVNNAKEAILNNRRRKIIPRSGGKIEMMVHQRDKILVEIFNSGSQIPPDQIDRIFDSYFTTKAEGSGIGLYVSKIIIEDNMAGQFYVRNQEDGVSFFIELPRTPQITPVQNSDQ